VSLAIGASSPTAVGGVAGPQSRLGEQHPRPDLRRCERIVRFHRGHHSPGVGLGRLHVAALQGHEAAQRAGHAEQQRVAGAVGRTPARR
jgi:hypothetical protein